MATIIEWGHFYPDTWFTDGALTWWNLTEKLKKEFKGFTLMYIDDTHSESPLDKNYKNIIPIKISFSNVKSDLSDYAKDIITEINKNSNATIDCKTKIIKPDFIYLQWEMKEYTDRVLDVLFSLSKRKGKPRINSHWIFCSGSKIRQPKNWDNTCLGNELGLTYIKDKKLWFDFAINVLPKAYEDGQELVKRVYWKYNPDFNLTQNFI